MNSVSVELYHTRPSDGLTAEDGSLGPYLVRHPKTLRTMAAVLAVMKLRRIHHDARRRIWKITALCLSGMVVFGIAAGFRWQATNEKLAVRNRRLEALVEVLRERKTNGSSSQVRQAARP